MASHYDLDSNVSFVFPFPSSAHMSCSPYQSPILGGDLCQSLNFKSSKSDGDSAGASPVMNGHSPYEPYEPKSGSANSLAGLDGPSASPVPPSSLDGDAQFNIGNLSAQPGFGGGVGYETLTQTLTYIAAQLVQCFPFCIL